MNLDSVISTPPRLLRPVPGEQDAEVAVFIEGDHYADNFGKQWRTYRDTQLDSVNGTDISKSFLEQLLGHPLDDLRGSKVLEIGSGAGRFTEHLVRYADLVVASDLSEAIFYNAALGDPNLVPIQADLFEMPSFLTDFDIVLCRGVIQHTPDPHRAIEMLHRLAGPQTRVVFDVYGKRWPGRFRPKYLWRPLIQRVFTYESFSAFLDRWTEPMLRMRWRLGRFLPGISRRSLDYLLPVWDYKGIYPLDDRQLVEWAKLDTLDAMFAEYDHPLSCPEVLATLDRVGARLEHVNGPDNQYRFRASSAPDALDG
jgi:SAM-dependent methyltransferase